MSTTEWDKQLNDLYRGLSTIPEINSGKFSSLTKQDNHNQVKLELEYTVTQRDLTRKVRRTYSHNNCIDIVDGKVKDEIPTTVGYPLELSSVKELISPSDQFKIILRHINNDPNANGKQGRYIEIFYRGNFIYSVDVTSIHDDFYGDSTFGCLKFSQGDKKVVYVAERKLDTSTKDKGKEEKETSDKKKKGLVVDDESELYDFNQEWGETFINRRRPSLFILHLDKLCDISTGALKSTFDFTTEEIVTPINLNNDNIDPGQACFHSQSDSIIYFTGYSKTPIKHGIVYCWNRPAQIYSVNIDGSDLKSISDSQYSARNPECLNSESGDNLFYLQSVVGGAHASCSRLIKNNLTTQKEHIIIDFIKEHTNASTFPGLFPDSLPKSNLSLEGKNFIVLSSQWRSRKVLVAVNIDSDNINNHPQDTEVQLLTESDNKGRGASWSLLDVKENYILASKNAPNLPSELLVGVASLDKSNNVTVQWTSIKKYIPEHEIHSMDISKIDWEVFSLSERDTRLECILIKAINLHPHNSKKSLMINIHGGPHSGNVEMWSWMNTILLNLGFDILHVNYSGSTGYGDNYVQKLVGNIGDLDVKDCQYAMEYVWNRNGDYHRRFVMGGSHGGFLTAHLIGQYPNYYQACALRNPVTNVGSMSFLSDISDWCFAEAGLPYDFHHLPLTTPSHYATMYNASPEQYIDQLQTPILLLLGLEDRRVPPSQGIQWYKHIIARHPDLIKVKLIPNVGHPLDTLEAESVSILQIGKHFLNHI